MSDLAESFDRKRPAEEGMLVQVTLRIVNLWAGLAPLQHNGKMSHSKKVVGFDSCSTFMVLTYGT